MPKGIYIRTQEHNRNIALSHLGMKHTEETKQKMRKPKSEEHKRNLSKALKGNRKGIPKSKEENEKNRKAHIGITKDINPNLAWSKQAKENIRRERRERWQKPGYREKMRKIHKKLWANRKFKETMLCKMQLGRPTKSTKPEKQLNKILKRLFPKEYKYVGDGSLRINGKNPDFANINEQKKLIELFGDYWHSRKITGLKKKEHRKQRQAHFAKYGYKTCVV